ITLRDLNGRFLYARNMERSIGWTQEDFVSMHADKIVHPDDRARIAARTREILEGLPGEPTRFRMRRKDGSWRWFEAVSAAVRDSAGAAIAVRSATREVTEDVERNRALRRSEELCRTALTYVPNACILLVDHDLRCIKAGGDALHRRIG